MARKSVPASERNDVSIRISMQKTELGILGALAERLGVTQAGIIRHAFRFVMNEFPQFLKSDQDEILRIRSELKRQGVNIMQITRALNNGADLPDERILRVLEDARAEQKAAVKYFTNYHASSVGIAREWKVKVKKVSEDAVRI